MFRHLAAGVFVALAASLFCEPASAAVAPAPEYNLETDAAAQARLRQIQDWARYECKRTIAGVLIDARRARDDCIAETMARTVDASGSVVLSANYDRYVNAGRNFARAFTRSRVINAPSWPERARYYPAEANGWRYAIKMQCEVEPNLHAACTIVDDRPSAQRFAAAAMEASRAFRASSHFADGKSTIGARVPVTLIFEAVDG